MTRKKTIEEKHTMLNILIKNDFKIINSWEEMGYKNISGLCNFMKANPDFETEVENLELISLVQRGVIKCVSNWKLI